MKCNELWVKLDCYSIRERKNFSTGSGKHPLIDHGTFLLSEPKIGSADQPQIHFWQMWLWELQTIFSRGET